MKLDPKKEFQKTPLNKVHADWASNPALQLTLQTALAEMVNSFSAAPDMGSAASYHFRLEGAKQFISCWLNLSEPLPERRPPPNQNLNPV